MSALEYWEMIWQKAWLEARRVLGLIPTVRLWLSIAIGIAIVIGLWFWGTEDAARDEMLIRGIAITAIVLALPFVWLWNCATMPVMLHNNLQQKVHEFEEAQRPHIRCDWRYYDEMAELILVNTSLKSLLDIDVSFRNYRKLDGSGIIDVLRSIWPVGGAEPPIRLDPHVPTYYRFAAVVTDRKGRTVIRLFLGKSQTTIQDGGVGVKFMVSGRDLPASTIEFRLTLRDDGTLLIEPWDPGGKAVT
jgi:hypothetical protein